jgi:hypothetical protein
MRIVPIFMDKVVCRSNWGKWEKSATCFLLSSKATTCREERERESQQTKQPNLSSKAETQKREDGGGPDRLLGGLRLLLGVVILFDLGTRCWSSRSDGRLSSACARPW